MKPKGFFFALLFAAPFALAASALHAEFRGDGSSNPLKIPRDPEAASLPEQYESLRRPDRSWIFYGGQFTATNFFPLLFQARTDYRSSYIMTYGLNQRLDANLRELGFEAETNLTRHFGIQKHYELNGMLMARWERFFFGRPWSIALGEGLSLASEKPRLEQRSPNPLKLQFDSQQTSALLNYIVVEFDTPLPRFLQDDGTRAFLRIHHRSGMFGVYCPPTCGSNYVTYGLRFPM